jgi:hypothetical protein
MARDSTCCSVTYECFGLSVETPSERGKKKIEWRDDGRRVSTSARWETNMRNPKRERNETGVGGVGVESSGNASASVTDDEATLGIKGNVQVDELPSVAKKRRIIVHATKTPPQVVSCVSTPRGQSTVSRDTSSTKDTFDSKLSEDVVDEKVDERSGTDRVSEVTQNPKSAVNPSVRSRIGLPKSATAPRVKIVSAPRVKAVSLPSVSSQAHTSLTMWTMHDRWDAERKEAERITQTRMANKASRRENGRTKKKGVAKTSSPSLVLTSPKQTQRHVKFVNGLGGGGGEVVARPQRPRPPVTPGFVCMMMSAPTTFASLVMDVGKPNVGKPNVSQTNVGKMGVAKATETRQVKSEPDRYRSQAGDHCRNCGRTLRHMFSENVLMCVRCKWSVPYYASLSGTPAFVEETEQPTNVLERVRGFKVKLLQYSEDRPAISQRYWHAVHAELVRNSMLTAHQIKPGTIDQIARELNLPSDIQACSVYMANTFAGLETAVFTHEECAILAQMYLEFKTVFTKLHRKGKGKAKFPKHNYYMYQFCMARRWYRRARTFPLLKDRRTLEEADRDYAPVAKILKWDFIRSI